jgi:hypothetical protein
VLTCTGIQQLVRSCRNQAITAQNPASADRESNRDFSTVKRGLADLLAFIAVNNDADDMMLVVDVGVRNRREI